MAQVRTTELHPTEGLPGQPEQRILVDPSTGAFRVALVVARPAFRLLSVSDGHTATQVWGSPAHRIVTVYHGSQRFLVDQVDGTPLRIVQAYLAGTAPPSGVRVRVVSDGPPAVLVATTATERLRITVGRAGHVPAAAFQTARGKATQVVRELHPGARPDPAITAYWLGPEWKGHSARSSSAASGRDGWYVIGYPHLDVEVSKALVPRISGDPVTLGDGTRASLDVVAVNADGSANVSSSDGGTFATIQFSSTDSHPGGTIALVLLPHAMIMLSGTAVTPRSAATIARSLRPL